MVCERDGQQKLDAVIRVLHDVPGSPWDGKHMYVVWGKL